MSATDPENHSRGMWIRLAVYLFAGHLFAGFIFLLFALGDAE
jgi:hypothetical protein